MHCTEKRGLHCSKTQREKGNIREISGSFHIKRNVLRRCHRTFETQKFQ